MVDRLASDVKRNEAVEILKRQIETERQLVRLYSDTRELIIDEQVKRLLHSLQLDSIKHLEMCSTAIEVLEGQVPRGDDRVELDVGLGHHMELEQEALNRADQLLRNPWVSENEGLRRLIEAWRDEEVAHHRLLRDLTGGSFTRRRLMDVYSGHRAAARGKLGETLRGLVKKDGSAL